MHKLKLRENIIMQHTKSDPVFHSSVYCAEYRSNFGILPFTGSLDLLSRETIDDDQAMRLADGWEIIVGMLGALEKEHPRHEAG